MKYLVIGAGGTGGSIAAFMTEAGKDVAVVARGAHLEAIRKNGMRMETTSRGDYTVFPLQAFDMDHYIGTPDVIFCCVKGYSLAEVVPFIQKVAGHHTIVIPLLNIFGTGGRMQDLLPDLLVTDGCIYISAEIKEPGTIRQTGDIFRVVFGTRKPEEERPALEMIASDLRDSGIEGIVSKNIRRDALQKFSYVSPMAACGIYFDVEAKAFQQEGKVRDTLIALMKEIDSLARAMGIHFTVDIVKTNLAILDKLSPNATTSMQRDWRIGKNSEIDGLLFEVVRMAKYYGVEVPFYEMISAKFGFAL